MAEGSTAKGFVGTRQFRPSLQPTASESVAAQAGVLVRVCFGRLTPDMVREHTLWFRWGPTGGSLEMEQGPALEIDLEAQRPLDDGKRRRR